MAIREFGTNRNFTGGTAGWTKNPITWGNHIWPDPVVHDASANDFLSRSAQVLRATIKNLKPPYSTGLPKWPTWIHDGLNTETVDPETGLPPPDEPQGSPTWLRHTTYEDGFNADYPEEPGYWGNNLVDTAWLSSDSITTGGPGLICTTRDAPALTTVGHVDHPAAWPIFGCTFVGAGNGFTVRRGGKYRLQMTVTHMATVEDRDSSLDSVYPFIQVVSTAVPRIAWITDAYIGDANRTPHPAGWMPYDADWQTWRYGGSGDRNNYNVEAGSAGTLFGFSPQDRFYSLIPIGPGESWECDVTFDTMGYTSLPPGFSTDHLGFAYMDYGFDFQYENLVDWPGIVRIDTFPNCYIEVGFQKWNMSLPDYEPHDFAGWPWRKHPNMRGARFKIEPGWSFAEIDYETPPPIPPPFRPPPDPRAQPDPPVIPPDGVWDVPDPPGVTEMAGPALTFPSGCEIGMVHLSYVSPTFDRQPSPIPNLWGASGRQFGFCEPYSILLPPPHEPVSGFHSVPVPIDNGIMPRAYGHFYGDGVNKTELWMDGAYLCDVNTGVAGATVEQDLYLPQVDSTVPHDFHLHFLYEDVPSFQTWDVGYQVFCSNKTILQTADNPPRAWWPWMEARTHYPDDYVPELPDGTPSTDNWGPFGAAVEVWVIDTIGLEAPSGGTIKVTAAAMVEFNSPAISHTCVPGGDHDPGTDPPPTPTPTPTEDGEGIHGGVEVSTDWGCMDNSSYKITAGFPGEAVSPYNTQFTGSGLPYPPSDTSQPAYIRTTFTPALNQWFFQSMVIYVPTGYAANHGEDMWVTMGLRLDNPTLAGDWRNTVVGLAVKLANADPGSYTVCGWRGTPDANRLFNTTLFGAELPLVEGQPNCLRMAYRQIQDPARTPFTDAQVQYQVNDDQTGIYQLETVAAGDPLASGPDNLAKYALWGLIDDYNHEPTIGYSQRLQFYIDDLRMDTTPVDCRCRPSLGVVMRGQSTRLIAGGGGAPAPTGGGGGGGGDPVDGLVVLAPITATHGAVNLDAQPATGTSPTQVVFKVDGVQILDPETFPVSGSLYRTLIDLDELSVGSHSFTATMTETDTTVTVARATQASGAAPLGWYDGRSPSTYVGDETWLNRKFLIPNIHVGGQGATTWASIKSDMTTQAAAWDPATHGRFKPMFSINMLPYGTTTSTPDGSNMAGGAAGSYDSHWTTIFGNMAAEGWGVSGNTCIVRVGHEFTGNWFPWNARSIASGGTPSDYAAYFRKIVDVARTILSDVEFDFSANAYQPNSTGAPALFSACYPGDSYTDYVGFDIYDNSGLGSFPDRWAAARGGRTYAPFYGGLGLDYIAAFAATHGKQISLSEWGLNVNSVFEDWQWTEAMIAWIKAQNVGVQVYYNAASSKLLTGGAPVAAVTKSALIFKREFGA